METIQKVVVSDQLVKDEISPWLNTRIIRRGDAHREIAVLKAQTGREILILEVVCCGMTYWFTI
jgi:hypothetical protein